MRSHGLARWLGWEAALGTYISGVPPGRSLGPSTLHHCWTSTGFYSKV